jgi:hypothetical protein
MPEWCFPDCSLWIQIPVDNLLMDWYEHTLSIKQTRNLSTCDKPLPEPQQLMTWMPTKAMPQETRKIPAKPGEVEIPEAGNRVDESMQRTPEPQAAASACLEIVFLRN